MAKPPLAIGEDVEAVVDQFCEEFRAPSAPVKDDCHPTMGTQESTHLLEDHRKHLGQCGVCLGSDDEEGVASCVVHPVIGSRWDG